MAAEPVVQRGEFIAEVRRLDQADAYNAGRLDSHIVDYRREASTMQLNIAAMDTKLDQLIDNQARVKGRDGVVLVLIGVFTSIMTAVITASILGVIR